MDSQSIDRRRFHELSAAALGGIALGAAGCSSESGKTVAKVATAAAGEKHLCRGLNECKGQGKSAKNDCRGQGDCATLAPHECGGHNACKGQGGCGETVGLNECKTKGLCRVPLMDGAWKTVRTRLEKKWDEAKQEFAAVPEKKS